MPKFPGLSGADIVRALEMGNKLGMETFAILGTYAVGDKLEEPIGDFFRQPANDSPSCEVGNRS
jgi:hypothetical protein